jgi:hypothetical protein
MQYIPNNQYTPFLRRTNYVGELNLPNLLTVASFADVAGMASDVTFDAAEVLAQEIQAPTQTPKGGQKSWLTCMYYGVGCPDEYYEPGAGILDRVGISLGGFFKNAGLLMFALILIAFGLYMLAKSTETGAMAVKAVTKL